MSYRMSQGCALALWLAMVSAMAVGFAAWGPIGLDVRELAPPVSSRALVLSCLPLLAVCLWGWRCARRSALPSALRGTWLAFFAAGALLAASSALRHAVPGEFGGMAMHASMAAAVMLLLLAFLCERMDVRFGAPRVLAGMLGVVAAATAWWLATAWIDGRGDLRALLFLECVPLLLVPAGAFGLRGRFTSSTDWSLMLGLYALARVADSLDTLLLDWTGWLDGRVLMHLLLAAVAACLAYRAGALSALGHWLADEVGGSSQRNTSLKTSL